jgi:hypothetical protein
VGTPKGWAGRPRVLLVVVAVAVTPVPVFFLLIGGQMAEITVGVVVSFGGPLVVIDDLIVIPDVVVVVVGVVDAIIMMPAGDAEHGTGQGGGQKECTDKARLAVHR